MANSLAEAGRRAEAERAQHEASDLTERARSDAR